ncbi:ABC-2 transporter permease [Paenibacillus caui]|uniref:ABC-2 transporter permease n=1 Tax=Paenibacillus caui TaxID=2873927 RepID=UPI001CA8BFB5|nr:ABC-2 transporter permease [Paenibacillus caui]
MNAIKNCLLVDLMSVMSKKSLLLFVALLLFYTYLQSGPIMIILPFMFAFFPFVNEDKGVTALYFSPSGKKDVVRARYLYCMLLLLATLLISAVAVPVMTAVTDKDLQLMNPSEYLFLFAAFTTMMAILLPFYFKYGYAKCQYSMIAVVFGVGILGMTIRKIPWLSKALQHLATLDQTLVSEIAAGAAAVMLLVSLAVSTSIVVKKDI